MALRSCCGSSRWVSQMLAHRPFQSRDRLRELAESLWRSLGPEDWKEAFRCHPRIGERTAARAQPGAGDRWSAEEQSGMAAADAAVRQELARVNEEYERRFGYPYVVCATGKPAGELLQIARERLGHDPAVEPGLAAEEQLKITLLRLDKLLSRGA